MANGQQTSVAAKKAGYAGMRSDASRDTNGRSYTSEEASEETPFGTFVAQGATDLEEGFLQLAAADDVIIGLLINSMAFAVDVEVGTTGLKPKMTGTVDSRGRALVRCEEDIVPTDTVFVRCVHAGAEVPGSVRTDADGGDAVDASAWARFLGASFTAADGNKVVEVEYDINNVAA